MSETTIVYLAGWGRSGSTLIARALGSLPGWTCVGETRFVWDLGVLRNSPCSCGRTFGHCPFWRAVFDRAFGDVSEDLAHRMISQGSRLHTWQMLAFPRSRLDRLPRRPWPGQDCRHASADPAGHAHDLLWR